VLAYALFRFRNSLIFHHLDKLTDLVIHLLPIVTMWNIHWNIRETAERKEWGFVDTNSFTFNLSFVWDMFYYFNIMYVSWASVYYLIILIVSRERIKQRGYWTLLQMSIDSSKFASKIRDKYGM
jgi:hypothetical protein